MLKLIYPEGRDVFSPQRVLTSPVDRLMTPGYLLPPTAFLLKFLTTQRFHGEHRSHGQARVAGQAAWVHLSIF